jgi:hypothetical protein
MPTHRGKRREGKEKFYELVEKTYDECPKNNIKIIISTLNAKTGTEEAYAPNIGKHSLHSESNDNRTS